MPEGAEEAYKTADVWKEFFNIVETDFAGSGEIAEVIFCLLQPSRNQRVIPIVAFLTKIVAQKLAYANYSIYFCCTVVNQYPAGRAW